MSTRFYITPYDPMHWKDENAPGVTSTLVVDFQYFSQAARSVWPSYRTYPVFSWEITSDNGLELSGGFSGEGNQILGLQRRGSYFNQFAAWYRTYIPSEYRLFLFAEGSWNSLDLTEGVTAEDVGQFTGYKNT